ncbi:MULTISPECIES: hypothetical protein [Actinomadura]|uniref:Uncharacterized protein n=1 Tax=Actinomadura yumaensis TaxID=111807 RepID=A0ABW2CBG8_9ACTN|nr:hypothetical protein [Actinomadura sp. J1-007]MWK33757.1 hypothetical protein [Actinomadura sp. J1-007]
MTGPGHADPWSATPTPGSPPRAAEGEKKTLLAEEPSRDLARDLNEEAERRLMAARVRAVRRARRDARTRSARVRRALLAPTSTAQPAGTADPYVPHPRRH